MVSRPPRGVPTARQDGQLTPSGRRVPAAMAVLPAACGHRPCISSPILHRSAPVFTGSSRDRCDVEGRCLGSHQHRTEAINTEPLGSNEPH